MVGFNIGLVHREMLPGHMENQNIQCYQKHTKAVGQSIYLTICQSFLEVASVHCCIFQPCNSCLAPGQPGKAGGRVWFPAKQALVKNE